MWNTIKAAVPAMMSRPRSLTAEMVSSNSCDVVAG
ncbi:Uncharacterised protein [Mycobacteroides abscessus subsp. abscessus]|nr:Uncharacterised protein [Mycobacteroides abscessus subsp. abscessus]